MDNGKNILGVTFLIIILLTFVVGGYFLMDYMTKNESVKNEQNEEIVDLRIDTTKDYIYYKNGVHIIESDEIHKESVVINFNTLNSINATLEQELKEMDNSIKYVKDMNLPKEDSEGNEITYNENEEGIYGLNYREYDDYKFGDYVSLVVKDYSYDIENGSIPIDLKSYVIDINTGKLINEEELLTIFNANWDLIKEQIKSRLTNTQVLVEETEAINIDETINNLDNYALFVNKVGKLGITFVVKSSQNNYNDSIEIN